MCEVACLETVDCVFFVERTIITWRVIPYPEGFLVLCLAGCYHNCEQADNEYASNRFDHDFDFWFLSRRRKGPAS
jgi:hypothetical protein